MQQTVRNVTAGNFPALFLCRKKQGEKAMEKKKDEEVRELFRKYYGPPDALLTMDFYRKKGEPNGDPITFMKTVRDEACSDEYDEYTGVYCLKCGEYHEYNLKELSHKAAMEGYSSLPGYVWDMAPCSCGTVLRDRDRVDSNISSAKRKYSRQSMWMAFPYRIKITEKGDKVRIAATAKNYYLNPKAKKPYTRKFTVTAVINAATGQSYTMPAVGDGKVLFTEHDYIRNATLSSPHDAGDLAFIDRTFLSKYPDVKAQLKRLLAEKITGFDAASAFSDETMSLGDIVDVNYLRGLYAVYPGREDRGYMNLSDRCEAWRRLRRRYHKNAKTFPRYLYWGCSDVATKSIRKTLYRHPEQKWTLYFLRHSLGITNIDVIRSVLQDRGNKAFELAMDLSSKVDHFRLRTDIDDANVLIRKIAESSLSDKDKIAYLLSCDADFTDLRDAARMMRLYDVPDEKILEHRNVIDLHNDLMWTGSENMSAVYEKYSKPVKYGKNVDKLEGKCGKAEFKVMRVPFDLDKLHKRFHNCVHTYKYSMYEGESIIIEMTLNGKPAACIELDGTAKHCRQAFAACNKELEGEAAEAFDAWSGKHRIDRVGHSAMVAPIMEPPAFLPHHRAAADLGPFADFRENEGRVLFEDDIPF